MHNVPVLNSDCQNHTYQIAIKIDDLQCRMTADHVCKLSDSILVLLSDAHSSEVEVH